MPVRVLALTARDPPSPSPARSLPVPFQSLPTPSANPTSRPTPTLAPRAPTSRGQLFSSPPGAPKFPRIPKFPTLSRFSALTRSNCSRSPRRWSHPGRFRRSSPRKGASSWRRARSHRRRAGRSALPAGLLPPSHPGSCKRGSPGGAVCSSKLFPTPQPSLGARAGAGHASRAGGALCVFAGPPGLLSRPRLPGTAWLSIG